MAKKNKKEEVITEEVVETKIEETQETTQEEETPIVVEEEKTENEETEEGSTDIGLIELEPMNVDFELGETMSDEELLSIGEEKPQEKEEPKPKRKMRFEEMFGFFWNGQSYGE